MKIIITDLAYADMKRAIASKKDKIPLRFASAVFTAAEAKVILAKAKQQFSLVGGMACGPVCVEIPSTIKK
jgi:hypothetical protein